MSRDAPGNPHRQQCGGNSVVASRRERPRAPVNRRRLHWLTMTRRLPNMSAHCGYGPPGASRKTQVNQEIGSRMNANEPRHDWTIAEVEALFALPFMELMFRAQESHRTHQPANAVQMSTLLSIKTGACPEDCAYCPQSVR